MQSALTARFSCLRFRDTEFFQPTLHCRGTPCDQQPKILSPGPPWTVTNWRGLLHIADATQNCPGRFLVLRRVSGIMEVLRETRGNFLEGIRAPNPQAWMEASETDPGYTRDANRGTRISILWI